jgi:putative membrane protein
MKNSAKFFLKGLLMGIADVIPGVSGGTIAFVTGIYQRLIHSLSSLDFSFIYYFLTLDFKKSWNIFKRIDFKLFIPLGLGIGTAVLLFSRVMIFLLENYTGSTFALFFGLILATSIYFLKKSKITFESSVFLVIGFLLAYVLAGATARIGTHSLLSVFFAGMFAICAMLLPGISGAFILLLLGQYEYVVGALHNFDLVVIGAFGIGAVFGLVLFSKLIDYMFKHVKKMLLGFLVGLMIGSLRVPWIRISEVGMNGYVGIFAVLGFLIFFLVEGMSKN